MKSSGIAVLFLVITFSCGKNVSTENFLLKPKDFQSKFSSLQGAVLLDVRTLEEVRKENLKGSINFDFNMPEFDVLIAGLDKTKPYFVYCASGVRSGKAAEKMRNIDIRNVYLLDGGLKAWKAEGLPTHVLAGAQ